MSDERIFRTIIHALRHDPWKYGLELDDEGFVRFEDLVTGLRFDRYDWALLETPQVERIVRIVGAGRFEVRDHRIRATYGHSIELGTVPPAEVPPELLFHGTSDNALPSILREGLKPIGRRFVHLTSDHDYAVRVAAAKGGQSLLVIHTRQMYEAGFPVRKANGHVWLTDNVEPVFLHHMAITIDATERQLS